MDFSSTELPVPLDHSLQKERSELAQKGSLGQRRRPSRASLKALITSVYNDTSDDSLSGLSVGSVCSTSGGSLTSDVSYRAEHDADKHQPVPAKNKTKSRGKKQEEPDRVPRQLETGSLSNGQRKTSGDPQPPVKEVWDDCVWKVSAVTDGHWFSVEDTFREDPSSNEGLRSSTECHFPSDPTPNSQAGQSPDRTSPKVVEILVVDRSPAIEGSLRVPAGTEPVTGTARLLPPSGDPRPVGRRRCKKEMAVESDVSRKEPPQEGSVPVAPPTGGVQPPPREEEEEEKNCSLRRTIQIQTWERRHRNSVTAKGGVVARDPSFKKTSNGRPETVVVSLPAVGRGETVPKTPNAPLPIDPAPTPSPVTVRCRRKSSAADGLPEWVKVSQRLREKFIERNNLARTEPSPVVTRPRSDTPNNNSRGNLRQTQPNGSVLWMNMKNSGIQRRSYPGRKTFDIILDLKDWGQVANDVRKSTPSPPAGEQPQPEWVLRAAARRPIDWDTFETQREVSPEPRSPRKTNSERPKATTPLQTPEVRNDRKVCPATSTPALPVTGSEPHGHPPWVQKAEKIKNSGVRWEAIDSPAPADTKTEAPWLKEVKLRRVSSKQHLANGHEEDRPRVVARPANTRNHTRPRHLSASSSDTTPEWVKEAEKKRARLIDWASLENLRCKTPSPEPPWCKTVKLRRSAVSCHNLAESSSHPSAESLNRSDEDRRSWHDVSDCRSMFRSTSPCQEMAALTSPTVDAEEGREDTSSASQYGSDGTLSPWSCPLKDEDDSVSPETRANMQFVLRELREAITASGNDHDTSAISGSNMEADTDNTPVILPPLEFEDSVKSEDGETPPPDNSQPPEVLPPSPGDKVPTSPAGDSTFSYDTRPSSVTSGSTPSRPDTTPSLSVSELLWSDADGKDLSNSSFLHQRDWQPVDKEPNKTSSVRKEIQEFANGLLLAFRRLQTPRLADQKGVQTDPQRVVKKTREEYSEDDSENSSYTETYEGGVLKKTSRTVRRHDVKKAGHSTPPKRRIKKTVKTITRGMDKTEEVVEEVIEEMYGQPSKRRQGKAATPTITRVVQKTADGRLYLSTTVIGDAGVPALYTAAGDEVLTPSEQEDFFIPRTERMEVGESTC